MKPALSHSPLLPAAVMSTWGDVRLAQDLGRDSNAHVGRWSPAVG